MGAVSVLSLLSCCPFQGLSDFCSSPDTYILNLTREETGLGSGDRISKRTPWVLGPLCAVLLGWGEGAQPAARPCPVPQKLSAPPLVHWNRGRDKDDGVRERGPQAGAEGWEDLATWRKWGEHS